MELLFYNSRTRQKQKFTPAQSGAVSMYVCGPTVYGLAHIGNARPAIVFDVLATLLRYLYPKLIYVRNITDIDDKINQKAQNESVDISVITARYHEQYSKDMEALGVSPPDIEPKATDYIEQMQEMIKQLIANHHAYEGQGEGKGHVLFDVTTDSAYGTLSGRNVEDMKAGARVEIASYKKNAADFVLWKPSSEELPGWESPWGRGRPGWHIECSVMILQHLGQSIDIHGGGADLCFPHHENEAAQSRCAHGVDLANFWLHNGMLNIEGEKMSKSLGNIKSIKEILEEHKGEVIRLALLQGQYRQTLDFTAELLQQSKRNLDKLYTVLQKLPDKEDNTQKPNDTFLNALCDDLNTPKALAELFSLAKSAKTPEDKAHLLGAGKLLGILQQTPEKWFETKIEEGEETLIESLLEERQKAKQEKNYQRADEIRDELNAMNIDIEDKSDGTSLWHKRGCKSVEDVYTKKVLYLAGNIPHIGKLDKPYICAKAYSKICGSKIEVFLRMDEAGCVRKFSQEITACALGQATASIVAKQIIGSTIQECQKVHQQMQAMLEGDEYLFAEKWQDLELLQSIKEYPHRHESTLLIFTAIEACFAQN